MNKVVEFAQEVEHEDEEDLAEDDVVDDEEEEEADGDDDDEEGRGKQSRSEKKSRKAMQKLGMKPVPGVFRVTIKRSKNAYHFPSEANAPPDSGSWRHGPQYTTARAFTIVFVISKPDVFKSPASDTFVIFGEAKIEDLNAQAQSAAAEQFKMAAEEEAKAGPSTAVAEEAPQDLEDDEAVDESDVNDKDITVVMSQANCTRSQAVKALRAADGDIVTAIMELSG